MSTQETPQVRPDVAEAVGPYAVVIGRDVQSPEAQAALATLGAAPVVTERVTGAPALHEVYLNYPSGGEVLVRDGMIAAFWFHAQPTSASPGGFDPAALLPGLPLDADWDAVKAVAGQPRRTDDSFDFGDVSLFVRLRRVEGGGRRGVESLFVRPAVIDGPVRSLDARCGRCADLAIRDGSGSLDLDATLGRLVGRVAEGLLRVDPDRVQLSDVRDLRTSGLMDRIEAHLDCSVCRTTWCLVVPREGEPTLRDVAGFGHEHPRLAVPPLEQWAGAARLAEAEAAMKVVDSLDGGWFLLEKGDDLYLDARYAAGVMDGSVLVLLNAVERAGYEEEGRSYISGLARTIDKSGPFKESSPWRERDLARVEGLASEVASAIGAWQQQRRWNANRGASDRQ